jgi:hypothetical protein
MASVKTSDDSSDRNIKQYERISRYATQLEMLSQLLEIEARDLPEKSQIQSVMNRDARRLYEIAKNMSYNWDMAVPRIDPLCKVDSNGNLVPVDPQPPHLTGISYKSS